MKRIFLRSCALALAVSLAGCTAFGGGGAQRGVEVTRFHLDQQVPRAQIAIEPVDQADANSLEFSTYSAAVARELTRLGWTVVQNVAQSEQVAVIDVEQGSRESLAARPSVSIGVGGSTGGWRSGGGAGVGVGIPIGGSAEIVATLLEARIKRRSDGTVFWEGRAQTEARAGSPEADRRIAVEKLAQALFRDFPGESGRTIRVE